MKKVLCFLLSALILSSGCSNTTKLDLPLRSYVFAESNEFFKPSVTLEEENKFLFCYSGLSSYLPVGTYEINDDELVLNVDDGLNNKYTFKIKNNTLIFNAEKSSELPSFANIPDGAVFK